MARAASFLLAFLLSCLSFAFGNPSFQVVPLPQPQQIQLLSRSSLSQPSITPFVPLQQTLIKDGPDVDTFFSFSLSPEPGRNISDYTALIQCSNHETLQPGDVNVAPAVLMQDGSGNFTAAVTFERSVGTTSLTFVMQRPDGTIYAQITCRYIIVGITFYHMQGTKKLYLFDNHLTIPSYTVLLRNELVLFYAFIQFPDGSTTESLLTDLSKLPSLSSIVVSITGNDLIRDHSLSSCVTGHAKLLPNGTTALSHKCDYGFTSFTAKQRPHFVLRLQKFRTGTVTLQFVWHDLLPSTSQSEFYETALSVTVSGKPTASVVAMTPPGPFRKAGGQLLRCALINARTGQEYLLKLGNDSIPPAGIHELSSGYLQLSFITPKGEGGNVAWDLVTVVNGRHESCPWAAETPRFVFNYLSEDIFIRSISPSFGPVSGDVTITCRGFFGKFSTDANAGDSLWFGSYRLDSKYIVSVDQSVLVFTLPPMRVVQPLSNEIDCWVVVHGIKSNSVSFNYASLTSATVALEGTSYNEKNDTHMVPLCSTSKESVTNVSLTALAHVNKAAKLSELKFTWHLVEVKTSNEVLTLSGGLEAQHFAVPLTILSVSKAYRIALLVSHVQLGTETKTQVQLQPTYRRMIGVGLTVDPSRNIAFPEVDARATAVVADIGKCFGSTHRLSYQWTFLKKTTTFSFETELVELLSPSPRRLGREFIIPKKSLIYGSHRIALKVLHTDNPDAYGSAYGSIEVQPAPLKPVIGTGESLVRVSSSVELAITASMSYDPDMPTGGTQHLSYHWNCELSTEEGHRFTSSVPCPTDFFSASYEQKAEFVFSPTQLRSIKMKTGSTFLRFSLFVKKKYNHIGIVSSSRTMQVVEILEEESSLSERGLVKVTGAGGEIIDQSQVPYFEPVILAPSAIRSLTWRYRLVHPSSDSFTFLKNPNNFLHLRGYYDPLGLSASRRPLGIRENVMRPKTTYTFELEFESPNANSTSIVQVTFQTMAKPSVTFLPLPKDSGSVDTLFSASAVPSVDHYSFKFYFFIKLSDGSEICVDGCSGQRRVTFKVPMPGKHTLRCVLVDARGKFVLAEAKEVHVVSISDSISEDEAIVAQSEALSVSLMLGDHGKFCIESVNLAAYAKAVTTTDARESELTTELVSVTLERLTGLYEKSQPNTQLAKDYMKIASTFASIPVGHEAVSGVGSFYHMSQMMYYAVRNTPEWERFDMLSELNSTLYWLTMHARQLSAGGSSRERLVRMATDGKIEVNVPLLDLSELTVPLWSRVAKGSLCGYTNRYEVGGAANISMGTYCSSEESTSLEGAYSRLEWCRDVYGDSGIRRVNVVLAEFGRDYITESGILEMRRSDGSVATVRNGTMSVSTRDLSSQGMVIVRTMVEAEGEDGDEEEVNVGNGGCLNLTQQLRATAEVFQSVGGNVVCDSAVGVRYVKTKKLKEKLAEGAYSEDALKTERFKGTGTLQRQAVTEVTSTLASGDGHYGVKRSGCKRLNVSTFGTTVGAWVPVLVIGVALVAIIAGVYGGMRMHAIQAVYATVEGGDATFIERDVYGRDMHYGEDVRVEVSDGDDGDNVDGGGQKVAEDEDEVVFQGRDR